MYCCVVYAGWDEHSMNDILLEAFSRPWTPRQLSILNSTDGSETVSQAMERVAALKGSASVNSRVAEEEVADALLTEDVSGNSSGA